MKLIKSSLAALALGLSAAGAFGQVTIVTYNMGTALGAPTQTNDFTGAGNFVTNRGTLATSTITGYSGPNGNAAVTTTNWATAGGAWSITLDLTGWESVSVGGWSQQASGTGPRDFQVFVSYDGGDFFISIGNSYSIANSNSAQTGFSLSELANENDSVIIEWRNINTTSVNDGTTGAGGTARFGNFEITAVSAIPEPSTYAALVGFLALGVAGLRRRQRA